MVVSRSLERKRLVVFDDLPLADKRGPLNIEIDLILNTTHGIDDGFDGGVDDFAAVHVDADLVADFARFIGHGQTITVTASRVRLALVDYRQIVGANLQQRFKLGDFKTLVLGVQNAEQYYVSSM